MQELEQKAFLLHSRPYRDHKVIVEFLTEQQGKISAIAYVGTSIKSNKKALLQPFLPLKIVLKGQGSLKSLARIEADKKSMLLTGDFLYSGFYLNELQVRLLGEHIPYEALFIQYQNCLQELAEKQPLEAILRNFENTLLDELGLTIDYSVIFEQNHQQYNYLAEQGFTPVLTRSSQTCYLREHLISLAEQDFSNSQVMHTYKLLMRQVFNHLLGGKPLNSRKLFKRN